MSAEISAMQGAHNFMKKYFKFEPGNAEILLRMENPLKFVATQWRSDVAELFDMNAQSTLDLSNLYRVRFYQSAVPQKKALCLDRLQGISRYLAVQLQVGVHQHLQCGLHFGGNSEIKAYERFPLVNPAGYAQQKVDQIQSLQLQVGVHQHLQCGLHFGGNSLSLFRRSKIPQDCGPRPPPAAACRKEADHYAGRSAG